MMNKSDLVTMEHTPEFKRDALASAAIERCEVLYQCKLVDEYERARRLMPDLGWGTHLFFDKAAIVESNNNIRCVKETDWRGVDVYIGGRAGTAAESVEQEMSFLLKDLPFMGEVDACAAWHHKFERIHPFEDGNGRVGRLIMFAQLHTDDTFDDFTLCGKYYVNYPTPSEFILQNLKRYYNACKMETSDAMVTLLREWDAGNPHTASTS